MFTFFDSHTHLMDEKYDGNWNEILKNAASVGVKYITNIGYNKETSYEAVKIADEARNVNGIEGVFATVGLHPENIDELSEKSLKDNGVAKEDFDFIYELAKSQKVVAIGEIGLDYHFGYGAPNLEEASSPNAKMSDFMKEKQKEVFIHQIEIANELKLPVVIHSRDADMDMLAVLKEHQIENGFVMHCFSSSVEVLKEVLKLGAYVSLAGPVTFKNARSLIDVAKLIPEDKLLVETDAPYLTPEPYRGKRNESAYVVYTAQKIADLRECSLEKISQITTENAKRFYGIN
ncbi:MAG: TatD family hydrolase [Clostridia bacterium]|nr:TatD family hydrolase [Clostridia bacterium]